MRSSKHGRLASLSPLAVATCLIVAPAQAQEQSSTKSDPAPKSDIVVTGSRIVRDGYDAPSPVTVATVEQLVESAPTNLPDALNKLPQMLGSSSPRNNRHLFQSNPDHGNLINLRGVGPSRTLILMDGRRVPPTTYSGAVDVNILPQLLIERVDVVTAGASAVYGSDAVAGVVNFVIDDDFVGTKGVAQYGISSRGDGRNYRIGGAIGHRFGDRLHVMVSAEHFDSAELQYKDREVGRRSELYGVGSTGIGTPGTATNPLVQAEPVRNTLFNAGGVVISGPFAGVSFFEPGVFRQMNRGTPTGSSAGGLFIGGDGLQLPSDRTLVAPLKTTQAFGRVSYDISDTTRFYTQAIWSKSQVRYAPYANGLGFPTSHFSGNPFLPAALQQQLTSTNTPSFNMIKVYTDDPSDVREKTDFHSFGAHLDGEISGSLKWSVDYDYGKSKHRSAAHNFFELRRMVAALDAVDAGQFSTGTPNGNIVCRVTLTNPGLYPGCAPFNPFGVGASSQAARDYVSENDAVYVAKISQHDVAANLSGDLFDTWAGTIAFSVGAEYRKQKLSLESNGDPAIPRDVTGLRGFNISPSSPRFFGSGNTGVAKGESDVKEVYGEINVPLARDMPFLQTVDLSGAFRYTDYSTSGGVETWKLGATWSPVGGLLFRGTLSRDIRAPTLYDLFAGVQTSVTGEIDPHTIPPALRPGGVPISRRGNPDLKPEIGKTFTVGLVARPEFLPGFALSLDYYNLKISKAIARLGERATLRLCELSNGTSPICDLIDRPLPFSDRTLNNLYTGIRDASINASSLKTTGFDLDASYNTELWGGTLSTRLYANYVTKFSTQLTDLTPAVEYAGRAGLIPLLGTGGAAGLPKIRGSLTLAYETGPFRATVIESMIGKVKYGDATQTWVPETKPINPVFYTDVTTSFRLPDTKNAELFLTINNLFDRDPPFFYHATATPGVTPSTLTNLYDIEGRRFTIGVRMGL